MIGYKNGEFLPLNKITIPADSLAVNRGFGAYDFFSVFNRNPFYLDRHLKRFLRTMELLKFSIPSVSELESIMAKLIELNSLSDPFGIKLFALPTEESNPPLNCELFFFPTPLIKFNTDNYNNGCNLLLREYKRFLPEAKSTNYLASQFYKSEIDKINGVDVLYHDNGLIRETSRGNFFLLKNGVVYTPKTDVLKGVTQSVLFDIMKKGNIAFKQQDIEVEMLKSADEIFVSSSTKLVLPIVNIDGLKIANGKPGELTKRLLKLFVAHKENYCK